MTFWLLQCYDDIISNAIPKHSVSNKRNRNVDQGNNNISNDHLFPHGSLGRLLRGGRNCCLDLQHHVVTSIDKCYITQSAKEGEDSSSCGRSCVCILHIWVDTLMNRSCPGNSWVTADRKLQKVRTFQSQLVKVKRLLTYLKEFRSNGKWFILRSSTMKAEIMNQFQ